MFIISEFFEIYNFSIDIFSEPLKKFTYQAKKHHK